MLDINHLFVFSKVAQLGSFSAAARALGVPKSNVSRAVALLEAELGARLFQRTTRKVTLTEIGRVLKERSADVLDRLAETMEYVGSLSGTPRGHIKVSAGTGFGINVLSVQLPRFLERYPQVTVTLDLESGPVDILGEEIDVAIRFGPLPASTGTPAPSASIAFSKLSSVGFRFDQGSGRWTVQQDGRDMPAVAPSNVLIQYVEVRSSGFKDVLGNPTPYTVTIGSGPLTLLRDGKKVEGEWRRGSAALGTAFFDSTGAPLPLGAGPTWVMLMPRGQQLRVG